MFAPNEQVLWKQRVLDRSLGWTANDLSVTTRSILQEVSSADTWAVIDLRGLPVDQVNGMHLAMTLRAIGYPKVVAGWDEALLVAREALIRDGLNANDALYGMWPKEK